MTSPSAEFWKESLTASLPGRRCSGTCTHEKEGDMQEGSGTRFSLYHNPFYWDSPASKRIY